MSKHTPGPWEMARFEDREDGGGEDWFRISGDSTLFLEVRACADGYVPNQNEANARLIAAAPDLLAALERLSGGLKMDSESHDAGCGCCSCEAMAAIAKATGR